MTENSSLSGGRDLHIFPSDGRVNTWLNDPKRKNIVASSTEEVETEEVEKEEVDNQDDSKELAKEEECDETVPVDNTFEDCRGNETRLHICVRIPSGEDDAEECM